MPSKDDVAMIQYGTYYANLSAFGKRAVDRAINPPSYNPTVSNFNESAPRVAKLLEELEIANKEKEDLWEELSEARAELEELRSKFNPPSS